MVTSCTSDSECDNSCHCDGTCEADLPNGFLVAYKPQGWTSFDVVGRVRGVLEKHFKSLGHKFGRKSRLKVGHGGTLDPMATGLLVLGVGDGCRKLQQYLSGPKAYVARAQLGAETDTQDAEGTETRTAPHDHVTLSELERAASGLTGDIMQRPPIYSALRKDGKRLYDLARAGEIKPEEEPCLSNAGDAALQLLIDILAMIGGNIALMGAALRHLGTAFGL